MLQYDLIDAPLFELNGSLPTEAEMCIFAVALMLVKDSPYSSLEEKELRLDYESVEPVAICIERQLSVFTKDVGRGGRLRSRLRNFAGMRIATLTPRGHAKCREAT